MPITSLDSLIDGMTSGERTYIQKESLSSSSGTVISLWKAGGVPAAGATPATGAGSAASNATDGAIPFVNPTSPDLAYIGNISLCGATASYFMLYDRLVHTSGLSGTVTTAQTVNSAALTRNTSGEGVECWLEQYTAVGTTARTATISYTNQAGTSGRTGTAPIGSNSAAGRMTAMKLQAGDTGVRSVESVTLSGTTGTAGDFGVTLLKRILDVPTMASGAGAVRDAFDIGLPQVPDNSCLALMGISSTTSIGPVSGLLLVVKN